MTERTNRDPIAQGDVLLRWVPSVPPSATRMEHDGRIVLAYGESTGHHHLLEAPPSDVEIYTTEDDRTFYRILAASGLVVTHVGNDHAPLTVPHSGEGAWELIRQVEYTPWGNRRVVD